MIEGLRADLTRAICEADRDTAMRLLAAHREGHGFEPTLRQLLDPVLDTIGQLWNSGDGVSLAQAYVAAKVAEQFMTSGLGAPDARLPRKGTVVIGNAEDDFHSLGRNMVGIFLRSHGWDTVDLGNDVTAGRFVEQAAANGAAIIGVSAMMYSTARNIAKVREELERRGLAGQIKLIAGGAVFRLRPELLDEIGADGTAANALAAGDLCDRVLATRGTRVRL